GDALPPASVVVAYGQLGAVRFHDLVQLTVKIVTVDHGGWAATDVRRSIGVQKARRSVSKCMGRVSGRCQRLGVSIRKVSFSNALAAWQRLAIRVACQVVTERARKR